MRQPKQALSSAKVYWHEWGREWDRFSRINMADEGLVLEEDGMEAEWGWFPSVDHGAWGGTGRRSFFIPNGDTDFSPGLPQ